MAMSKSGPAKRYGTRYGRRLRERVGKIETEQRSTHVCPFCKYKKVKRVSAGIWSCQKCSKRFASRAYTVSPKLTREVQ